MRKLLNKSNPQESSARIFQHKKGSCIFETLSELYEIFKTISNVLIKGGGQNSIFSSTKVNEQESGGKKLSWTPSLGLPMNLIC